MMKNKGPQRSLNESARRHKVDKLNMENKMLVDRLKSVPAVLNANKLESDFQRHVKIGSQLRRRQMQLMTTTPASPPPRSRPSDGSTFDADLYMAQHTGSMSMMRGNSQKQRANLTNSGENVLMAPYDESSIGTGAPIATMQDFRREVISKKVLSQHQDFPQSATAPKKKKEPASYEFSHNPEF